jgi:uncharacterized protein (DUF362 family)/Pyruvate/2-oxoacid:ferredoxin oxidoreductase delta subunit
VYYLDDIRTGCILSKLQLSITRAYEYNYDDVYAAVEKALSLIGGLSRFVPAGSSVFVKINHLSPPSPAERGIVTHPVFAEAVVSLLKEITTDITVGDDIDSSDPDGFEVSGYRRMCQKIGVKLLNLREEGFVQKRCDGYVLKQTYVSKAVLDADVIINLPKMKTHSLAVFTGAVKNMYGILPSGIRHKYHAAHAPKWDFSQMLVDVYTTAIPQLNIMDGIMAMEGAGPAGGTMRNVGVVLACADAVALDSVASQIIGLKPTDVRTTAYAVQRGIGIADPQYIEVLGETIDSVKVADFKHPAGTSSALVGKAPKFLAGFIINNFVDARPNVVKKNCTGCGECEKICPVQAVVVSSEVAKVNDSICIKCMCCHEVCRYDAIVPRKALAGRMIDFATGIFKKASKR